jgi:formylglycine-generating enzyme required for sulfatase activity
VLERMRGPDALAVRNKAFFGVLRLVSRVVRASDRVRFVPAVRYDGMGFRCVGE